MCIYGSGDHQSPHFTSSCTYFIQLGIPEVSASWIVINVSIATCKKTESQHLDRGQETFTSRIYHWAEIQHYSQSVSNITLTGELSRPLLCLKMLYYKYKTNCKIYQIWWKLVFFSCFNAPLWQWTKWEITLVLDNAWHHSASFYNISLCFLQSSDEIGIFTIWWLFCIVQ